MDCSRGGGPLRVFALSGSWLFFFIWLGDSKGFGLSYEAAKGRVGLMLPVEALQIDFSKHYHQIRNVDFSINEQAFLDWCRAAKWTPTPIEEEARVSPVQTPDTEIVVTDGYQAVTVPIDGDFGGTVIYDRKRGRTFYRFHSF